MTMCSRCCSRTLHADITNESRRLCPTGPVTSWHPRRHQRLLKRGDQQAAAARSTCIARASAVEAVDASSAVSALEVEPPQDGPTAQLVAVVPEKALSQFGIPWTKVMAQMARRLSWVDPAFEMQVHQDTAKRCSVCREFQCSHLLHALAYASLQDRLLRIDFSSLSSARCSRIRQQQMQAVLLPPISSVLQRTLTSCSLWR